MKFACRFLCVLVGLSCCSPLHATVTVQTTDGRVVIGKVDPETDGELLWLRQQRDGIQLTTSLPWDSVVTAARDGEEIEVGKLREASVLADGANVAAAPPLPYLVLPASHVSPPIRRMPQVRSLQVEAFLVNLDRDVEPDGIQVVIAALDEHGLPVPVEASLYARLWGERTTPPGGHVRFEELDSWTQPVVPLDFVDGVASYALPFRTTQPEREVWLRPDAVVNVRLGVFGQGNFAASAPVPIRAFNSLRDRAQLFRDSRFFPGELTGGRQQVYPVRSHSQRHDTWSR